MQETNIGSAQRMSAPEKEQVVQAGGVAGLLQRLEYRRCDEGEDLEAIYRLRYESYRATGMVEANKQRIVADEYDDLPNSYRYAVYIDGRLVSTIRLHHVSAEHPLSPSMTVFGDALQERLNQGETFVDPSRFAADLEASREFRMLPYLTLRLAVVASAYFEPTYCLTAIKEEHAGFYKRIFNATQALPARTYPGLNCPVFLFQSRTSENLDKTIERFPFFASTQAEQEMLFATKPAVRKVAAQAIKRNRNAA